MDKGLNSYIHDRTTEAEEWTVMDTAISVTVSVFPLNLSYLPRCLLPTLDSAYNTRNDENASVVHRDMWIKRIFYVDKLLTTDIFYKIFTQTAIFS